MTITGPRLAELGPFQATPVWETNRPVRGEVAYCTGTEPERSELEEKGRRRHVVRLVGLLPETIYRYRLGRRAKDWYEFRTAQTGRTAFRFMICAGDGAFGRERAATLRQSIRTELPDFILLAGRLASRSERYALEEGRFFGDLPEAARLPLHLLPARDDLRTVAARAR